MNEILCVAFSLISILTLTNGQFFGTDSVRFDVEKIVNCDENAFYDWHLDIVTLNNTHVSISFNVTLDRNFDNSMTLIMEFYQWNSKKEWKRVIGVSKKKACNFIKVIGGDLIYKVGKEVGIEHPGCPILKSFLHLENRVVDVQSTVFGKFLVGRFKGIVKGLTSKKEYLFWGMGSFRTTKI